MYLLLLLDWFIGGVWTKKLWIFIIQQPLSICLYIHNWHYIFLSFCFSNGLYIWSGTFYINGGLDWVTHFQICLAVIFSWRIFSIFIVPTLKFQTFLKCLMSVVIYLAQYCEQVFFLIHGFTRCKCHWVVVLANLEITD